MAESMWDRLQVFSTKAAILLASLAAVLSLGTGLANLTVGISKGPLSRFVPELIQQTAGFTGTLTGFLMLLAVWQLRHARRVGWYATVLLLPITALQGIIQVSIYSFPLVVLSLISLPTLLVNRRRFDQPINLTNAQMGSILALSGTLAYGTVGTYTLRENFERVDTVTDAFYYTIVTASTVGYGDVIPKSEQATLFTISLVVIGTASFAVTLGSVLGPTIEARFSRALGNMTDSEYHLLEGHVLVLGYGELTEPLMEELADETFVVITPDPEQAKQLRDQDCEVLVGNPSDEKPLHDAGIEHARAAIVATNNDAEDAFSILTARELNPDLRIVAAATVRDNIQKLRRAGADSVVSPAVIGGRLLVQSALSDDKVETLVDKHIDET